MRLCREDDNTMFGTCNVRQEAIIPTKGESIKTKSKKKREPASHRHHHLLAEQNEQFIQ